MLFESILFYVFNNIKPFSTFGLSNVFSYFFVLKNSKLFSKTIIKRDLCSHEPISINKAMRNNIRLTDSNKNNIFNHNY